MKRKVNFIFVKPFFIYALFVCLIIFTAFKSESSMLAAKKALALCASTVIPTLFPFFVFSSCLINSGFAAVLKKPASFIMRPLFNVNGSGALAFIIGILSGYPAGARTICELKENGLITHTEAERLLPFCNNSGPLFIIGAAGSAMLKSHEAGIFLYMVHVLSAVLVGICFRFYKRRGSDGSKATFAEPEIKNMSFSGIFSKSVEGAVISILNICGFIVIFSCISTAFTPIINTFFKSQTAALFTKGLLEITLGISEISATSLPFNIKITLTSFLLGISGICVVLQVAAIAAKEGIGIKTYVLGKTLHGCFSAFICMFLPVSEFLPASGGSQTAASFTFFHAGYTIIIALILIFAYIRLKNRKLF